MDFGHATEQYLVAAKNLIMKYFFIIFLTQVFSLNHSIETKSLFSFKGEFFDGTPMGIPMNVSSFEDGSFILHENNVESVKLFSEDGTLEKVISQRGRGPGEFLDIDNIKVNNSGDILVLDHKQLRISMFSKNGEVIDDYKVFRSRPRARSIHHRKDSLYIFGSIRYSELGNKTSTKLFFVTDQKFNRTGIEFGQSMEYTNEDSESLPSFVMAGGKRLSDNSVLLDNGDLLVSPMLYEGFLLLYTAQSDYQSHQIVNVEKYGKSYEEYEGTDRLNFDLVRKQGLSMLSNQAGRRIFYHFNRSLGLFKLNTGEILHFAQIKRGEEADLIVEFINEEGSKVIGTQTLRNIGDIDVKENTSKKDNHSRIDLVFHHMDKNNRLYVSRMGKDYVPELHVVQIKLSK